MSELIHQLTLGAGLNTTQKITDYLEISTRTWRRKLDNGRLKKVEYEALQHKAGFLLHGQFKGYKIVKNKLFSPQNNFANPREIANMSAIRELLNTVFREIDDLKKEIKTLKPEEQQKLFGKYKMLDAINDNLRLEKLFIDSL
jgi:hypothetical protein